MEKRVRKDSFFIVCLLLKYWKNDNIFYAGRNDPTGKSGNAGETGDG